MMLFQLLDALENGTAQQSYTQEVQRPNFAAG